MDHDYKVRKEAFVSNLSGGSINEINIVTLVASVGIPPSDVGEYSVLTRVNRPIVGILCLVRAPVTFVVLHTVFACRICHRLPVECLRDPLCDDTLCLTAIVAQCLDSVTRGADPPASEIATARNQTGKTTTGSTAACEGKKQ